MWCRCVVFIENTRQETVHQHIISLSLSLDLSLSLCLSLCLSLYLSWKCVARHGSPTDYEYKALAAADWRQYCQMPEINNIWDKIIKIMNNISNKTKKMKRFNLLKCSGACLHGWSFLFLFFVFYSLFFFFFTRRVWNW